MAEFPKEQGKFYAHQDTDKDLVVCEAPQRIDPPAAAAAETESATASAAAASGYYHFSSSGVKHKSKWDDFDADAECAKLDEEDDDPAPRPPARARARAQKPAGTPTPCGVCTFINLAGAATCEMCGTALGGAADGGFTPYTCAVSAFAMLKLVCAGACAMCGTPKSVHEGARSRAHA